MAGGKTHSRYAENTLLVGTFAAVGLFVVLPPAGAGLLAGLIYGLLCPPDLDHHVTTEDQHRFYRIHPRVGRWWENLWHPYDQANVHRGRSHNYPAGTWDRFWYLLKKPVWLSLPLSGLAGLALPHELGLAAALACWLVFWVALFAGQSIQDLVHIWTDAISSWWKRIKKTWPMRWFFPPRRRRAPAKYRVKTR